MINHVSYVEKINKGKKGKSHYTHIRTKENYLNVIAPSSKNPGDNVKNSGSIIYKNG